MINAWKHAEAPGWNYVLKWVNLKVFLSRMMTKLLDAFAKELIPKLKLFTLPIDPIGMVSYCHLKIADKAHAMGINIVDGAFVLLIYLISDLDVRVILVLASTNG